jgi:four helix bundle protein
MGTECADAGSMASYCLEDLQVFQKSIAAADAISALTNRPEFVRDRDLCDQLRAASGGVPSHISEGHGQKTDRHFAHYLYIARGTTKEMRAHLRVAKGRGYITESERAIHSTAYEEIAKMLTGLIRHLEREDRRRRG